MPRKRPLDWSKLPEHLRYLAAPAEKYGGLQFDNRILDYLEKRMTEGERGELIELGLNMARDWDDINSWLDKFDFSKHREAELVYFTGHMIGLGNDSGVFDTWPWRK
ncbi:MAG TPA: hypothetical protein VE999_18840 [Gemmataceae bacterium]|nr:hypothetical protein [Gemmataceae bacterium]